MARTPEFMIGQTLLLAGGMWRRNLLKLGGANLAVSIPGTLVQVALALFAGLRAGTLERTSDVGEALVTGLISLVSGLVTGALLGGINGYAAAAEVRGEKATFVGGWKAAWGNMLPQMGIQLILGVLFIVAGFVSLLFGMFFIVPFLASIALIIAFLGLAPMMQVVERHGVFGSLGASVNAGEGNHLKMLGYYLIAYIGAVIALLLIYIVIAILTGIVFGLTGLGSAISPSPDGQLPIPALFPFLAPLYLVFTAAIPLALGSIPASVYVALRKHRSEHAVGSVFD